MAPLTILILGTCDTKLSELLYLRSRLLSHHEQASILLIDVGRSPVSHPAISISQHEIVTKYRGTTENPWNLEKLPRSEVVAYMIEGATACVQHLCQTQSVHAVVSIGGSGGTSLAAAAMRHSVPFTVPKLIVSTVASGDTSSFVGENDITMMYSIVDIAGSNKILKDVLDNAAGATVGMAVAYRKRLEDSGEEQSAVDKKEGKAKKRVGITMFGVTTPCVDAMRQHLTEKYGYEVFVFHATGHGGRAMERMISAGELDAVVDLTTTEIADHIVGGVMSAGPHRLEAAAKAEIPQVLSVGACDMVNFGPRSTVPERFAKGNRNIYEHNPSVTLMRTDAEECRQIGEFIAGKLKKFCRSSSLVQVILPTGGVSMIAKPGDPYYDREADDALFTAVEEGLKGKGIEVLRDERDINDDTFALETAERLVRLIDLADESTNK
ncbi:MAG: hypothetical protein HETSPECPRED_003337 [Heterodermia speciosa]|uniref:Uncharacterized protein n=1 Tax=Heterodermia speciosa TaxID=116794 RepID=A0A8H3EJF3_9LECA|nr:MAG: hypothetical protein HETSPECPRED_003337 [Heterodermia speciosa]